MDEVFVLYFFEWGWDLDQFGCSGNILGVFSNKNDANIYMQESMYNNNHGNFDIKKVKIDEYASYGW